MKFHEMYREGRVLIARGAEAYVYKVTFGGCKAVMKIRLSKTYRHTKIDLNIREQRTRNESLNMIKAMKAGVNVPTLYYVNLKEFSLIMEYIEGIQLTKVISKENLRKAGKILAELHENNIAHWDYTTSNILVNNNELYVIDFGLSIYTKSIMDKAIDVHLMSRSLRALTKRADQLIESFWKGYSEASSNPREIKEMVKRIESMGRYVKTRRKTVW